MSESKHTPGPWAAQGDMVLADDQQMLVADVRGWSYLTKIKSLSDEEAARVMDANAHLIAAAPELAEALRELHDFAEPNYGKHRERSAEAFAKAAALLQRLGL